MGPDAQHKVLPEERVHLTQEPSTRQWGTSAVSRCARESGEVGGTSLGGAGKEGAQMSSGNRALSLPARSSCHLCQVTLPRQLILLLAKRLRQVSMATAAGLPLGSAGSSGSALGTDTHSTNTSPAGALLQLVPLVKRFRQKKKVQEAASRERVGGQL